MKERKIKVRCGSRIEEWTLRLSPIQLRWKAGGECRDAYFLVDWDDRTITVAKQRRRIDTAAAVAEAVLVAVNRAPHDGYVSVREDGVADRFERGRHVA